MCIYVVIHLCNCRTQECETGGLLQVQGQLTLLTESLLHQTKRKNELTTEHMYLGSKKCIV